MQQHPSRIKTNTSHPDDRRHLEAADTPLGRLTSASYGLGPIAERTRRLHES